MKALAFYVMSVESKNTVNALRLEFRM